MPLGYDLQPLPPDSGRLCQPQKHFNVAFGLFLDKMSISKFVSDTFWEKRTGGGVVNLRTLLIIKKCTRTPDFQSNGPPPNFV